jgi:AcrR family transcriptional regulator
VANPLGEPDREDLTARARIRGAALALFADRGVDGASVRDVARAAGVSGGLVRHHFGSKEGLRDACDAYALGRLMRLKEEAVLEGQLASPGFLSAAQPEMLGLYRYLARSMMDGSPAAQSMFDEMVDLGEQWLTRHNPGQFSDPRSYAAVLVAMEMGGLAMRDQLSRALGADVLSPEGHLRLARAKIEFYSQPAMSPELAEAARAAIDQVIPTPEPPQRHG